MDRWSEIEFMHGRRVNRGIVIPSLAAAVVATASGTANTYGSYVQMLAAASNTKITVLTGLDIEAITGFHQIAVAIGDAGSEVIITEVAASRTGQVIFARPLAVGPNQRMSIKTAAHTGSQTVTARLLAYEGE